MKHLRITLMALMALLVAVPAFAAVNDGRTWYVSQNAGSNRNDGSKGAPLKNIQKAIDLASQGDVILVAEGNYYGLLNSGNIKINKGLSIFGGYSDDFSTRDILVHRTYIQPSATSNGTAQGQGTIQINVSQNGTLVELDGLIMDRGNSVAYNPRGEGRPAGVDSPMMQPIGSAGIGAPGVPEEKVYTTETAIVYINTGSKSDVTIRNCAFLNGPNFGIMGSTYTSKVIVDNCIFVNIRMVAIQLGGASAAINSEAYITNNTILFTWTRLKDFGDMGYGYSYRPKMDSYLDHNIIGCSMFAALDRTRVDSPASKEAERVTTCENTLFFLNRQADLVLPGGGLLMRVNVDDFDDVEQLEEDSGNKEITDPAFFGGAINEAYLKGFLAASYSEKLTYDSDSSFNTFRKALGRDMTGTMTSSASMFANHYPVEDALKLFGAVPGYGAQLPE
ncbi:MAG: DUF1565 domain-containing protein [Bacteroidales bacterium]|nr:DUF1565 domain-containing protein [Bacteroidales bacterium]